MKKILKILVWVLTIGGITFLWGYTRNDYLGQPLKSIELIVTRPNESIGFIDYNIEKNRIVNICDTAKNNQIRLIPVDSVVKVMKSIPWVVAVEAEINLDKVLIVKLVECNPIMRIYNEKNQSVYLDSEGKVYPSKMGYAPHVLIGNGNLKFKVLKDKSLNVNDSIYGKSSLPKMYEVMKSVVNDSFSKSCVKQVYRVKPHEYELVLNDSEHRIILGDENDIDSKLLKMKIFFKQMQGNPELKNYGKINLNYNNQVVCTKI